MSTSEKVNVEELETTLASKFAHRSSLINQLKAIFGRKEELRKEIRETSAKIRAERESLNNLYKDSEESRKSRRETLAKIREIRGKINQVQSTVKQYDKLLPRGEDFSLSKTLEQIEWKLQTERLTREKEKELVKNVKQLEKKLVVWRKANTARKERTQLFSELSPLKERLDKLKPTEEVYSVVMSGEERLQQLLNMKGLLIQQISSLDNEFVSLQKDLAKTVSEIDELKKKKHSIWEENKRNQFEERRRREDELLQGARERATQKLKSGEKLSFNELKLIFGAEDDESIDQN